MSRKAYALVRRSNSLAVLRRGVTPNRCQITPLYSIKRSFYTKNTPHSTFFAMKCTICAPKRAFSGSPTAFSGAEDDHRGGGGGGGGGGDVAEEAKIRAVLKELENVFHRNESASLAHKISILHHGLHDLEHAFEWTKRAVEMYEMDEESAKTTTTTTTTTTNTSSSSSSSSSSLSPHKAFAALGFMFDHGQGCESDANAAFFYYERAAARATDVDDVFRLAARMHELHWLLQLKLGGDGDGDGDGAQRLSKYTLIDDYKPSNSTFSDAKKQNEHDESIIDGVNSVHMRAVYALLGRAAHDGHVRALVLLGTCFHAGDGFENGVRKVAEARELWKQAADMGSADANYNLGVSFAHIDESTAENDTKNVPKSTQNASLSSGDDAVKDDRIAFDYWMRACELGHLKALSNVAWCYANGRGVDKDDEKAHYYLTKLQELIAAQQKQS